MMTKSTELILASLCLVVAFVFFPLDVAVADGERTGTLLVIGGGRTPEEVADRFLELAGGEAGKLVVIPTAGDSPASEERIVQSWKKRGFGEVTVLHTTDREVADSEAFVAPLQQATAVWISGGRQSRLANAYVGTRVEKELSALVARGGVIAGSSAGAAIQSQVMIVHSSPVPEIGRGFDLVPDAIIDQHFLVRNRLNRLIDAVHRNPGRVGIGIDESTAIEVQGRQCKVLGKSFVVLISESDESGSLDMNSFNKGDTFSLQRATPAR